MPRFYETDIESVNQSTKIFTVRFTDSTGNVVRVQVSRKVFDLIQELQREFWRTERRESRHCVHLDAIPDRFIPHNNHVLDPEEMLIQEYEHKALRSMLDQIPEKQKRRFIMRYEYCLSSKEIAEIENCSERSIQYSLMLAKNNLRDILDDYW